VPRDDVVQQADELVRFAMGLLAEDERRRIDQGDEVAFGPWLSGRSASRVEDKVARLVTEAADIRLRPDLTASAFTTTKSFAALAGLERTRLFADIAPRAQLLATIMAAGFAVDGMLAPVGAYLMYADGGQSGRDAHAYGIHNPEGEAAFSRVIGLAAIGHDTCVPVTAHALVAGMPQGPRDIMRGREAMGEWGLELPSDLGDHVAQALRVVNAARDVVEAASDGSRTCGHARIRPADLLEAGLSRWILLGAVHIGPRRGGSVAAGQRIHPGLDAAVMHAAMAEGFRAVAHAADLTVSGQAVDVPHPEIMYAADGRILHGSGVLSALLEGDRDALPALRELSNAQLRAAEEHSRTLQIPCTIGARYLVLPRGVLLTGRAATPVGAIVRVGPHASTMWTTTVDLGEPGALAEVVARAELHVRSIEEHTLNRGVKTYFRDHELHRLQAESYRTHTAMRIVTMLANLAAVGVARAHQTGTGPTR
jgi:hypothetical protein